MADLERERRGAVEILRINRPAARNALSYAVMGGIGYGVRAADVDPEVGAVVITGTGDRAFCAGADLANMAKGRVASAEERAASAAFIDFIRNGSAKPVIAAANGTAVGGGFELVLACDLAVASAQARFGLPEVRRGLLPAGGGVLLGQRIPMALALEYLLTGESFDASRALALGLVNRVVAHEDVVTEAVALAEAITANGPLAVRTIKALARAAVHQSTAAMWELQAALQPAVFGSRDAAEGATAFMEKRAPHWTGT